MRGGPSRSGVPDVLLLGGSVIDFEPHATATLLNLDRADFQFDALASLLYVDRRGAPESRQLGLDAIGKAALLKALADTSRNCPSGRQWITEVNWPLREGPHSPAGRDVAVDEDLHADYLLRYLVPMLASGLAERVFWWQLLAKGYGLIDPTSAAPDETTPDTTPAECGPRLDDGTGWRRRPAWFALRRLMVEIPRGARVTNIAFRMSESAAHFIATAGAADPHRVFDTRHPERLRGVRVEGGSGHAFERWLLWAVNPEEGGAQVAASSSVELELADSVVAVRDRSGQDRPLDPVDRRLAVGGSPIWLDVEARSPYQ